MICATCGHEFTRKIWSQKYCSAECNPVLKKQREVIWKHCLNCGRRFIANPSSRKRCNDCQAMSKRSLSTIEYRHKRTLFLSKFKNQCQSCHAALNEKTVRLHHILPLGLGGKDRIENITILCEKCHRKVHHPKK